MKHKTENSKKGYGGITHMIILYTIHNLHFSNHFKWRFIYGESEQQDLLREHI